ARERGRLRLGQLAARQDPRGAALTLQVAVQRRHPGRKLFDPHVVVVPDVRRGAHALDSVGLGLPRHRDALARVEGTVVDAREDVAVEVDHAAAPAFRASRRSSANDSRMPSTSSSTSGTVSRSAFTPNTMWPL